MTDRDPKTGRFVRPEPDEIPPFDRHDFEPPERWSNGDTLWAALLFFGIVAALVVALS